MKMITVHPHREVDSDIGCLATVPAEYECKQAVRRRRKHLESYTGIAFQRTFYSVLRHTLPDFNILDLYILVNLKIKSCPIGSHIIFTSDKTASGFRLFGIEENTVYLTDRQFGVLRAARISEKKLDLSVTAIIVPFYIEDYIGLYFIMIFNP